MNLVRKLLGRTKHSSKRYPDAGMTLTLKLIGTLGLKDWQNGLPSYTPEEIDAIDREITNFQSLANEEIGGKAVFHPDAVDGISRHLAATALEGMAGRGWRWSEELPENWKKVCSTYLKAWASKMNPSLLLDMAGLLAKAGYEGEAREALQVVLLFPSYANAYFAGADATGEVTNAIVERARKALAALLSAQPAAGAGAIHQTNLVSLAGLWTPRGRHMSSLNAG